MPDTIHLPLLDRIEIASPCHARWKDMTGDERTRHCAECNLKVHNISALSRDDAESLLRASIGADRVCVRLFRRADGTIITRDCPVGLARVRAAARRTLIRAAALFGLVSATGVAAAATSATPFGERLRLRALRPFSIVCDWIAPQAANPPPMMGKMSMGAVAPLPSRPAPPVSPNGGGQ
ncbi:MAG TPA: hypothetical protein VHC70_09160 [Phycisphaerales bacterium]|jgi:hypothetical protein|nr:hypothetical protein [Phycisphaerales bacterium]